MRSTITSFAFDNINKAKQGGRITADTTRSTGSQGASAEERQD